MVDAAIANKTLPPAHPKYGRRSAAKITLNGTLLALMLGDDPWTTFEITVAKARDELGRLCPRK